MTSRISAIVTWSFVLTACVPFPHYSKLTPAVSGEITRGGSPISELHVRLATGSSSDACGGKFKEARTNDKGEFSVPPVKELNAFIVIMAHRFYTWNICIKESKDWVQIGSNSSYALADSGPYSEYTIHCDMSNLGEAICKFSEAAAAKNAT